MSRTLRLRPRPGIAQLLAARNAFQGHESLEHQLAGGHHHERVLFRREPDLIHQVEITAIDAMPLMPWSARVT